MPHMVGDLKGLDTCGRIELGGQASSSECYRGGYLWLETPSAKTLAVPTTCKSWTCLGCRDRVMRLVQMRMAYGCLILGRCVFTTFTLRADYGKNVDALGVQELWRKFLYRWKRRYPEMTASVAWFKVPELTKRNVPHLHVLMGPMSGKASQIQTAIRPIWREVTDGTSFIVDVRPVWSVNGLVSYLEKYFTKHMLMRETMESLGFVRRYSRSQNWPSDQLILGGIESGEIKAAGWTPFLGGDNPIADSTAQDPRLWRKGTDLGLALSQARGQMAALKNVRRLIEHGNRSIPSKSVTEGGSSGH